MKDSTSSPRRLSGWLAVLILLVLFAGFGFLLCRRRVSLSETEIGYTAGSPPRTETARAETPLTTPAASRASSVVWPEVNGLVEEEIGKRSIDEELRRQRQASVEATRRMEALSPWQRLYGEATRERLKEKNVSQTVHGRIVLPEGVDLEGREWTVYADRDGMKESESLIIDGEYSLGSLPAGKYKVVFVQRDNKGDDGNVPGAVYHNIEISQGQASLPLDFRFGPCSVEVRLIDADGRPVEDADAVLTLGGTDLRRYHQYKVMHGLTQAGWVVNNLIEGPYLVKAEGKAFEAITGFVSVKAGKNLIEVRIRPDGKGYVFGLQDLPELEGKTITGLGENGQAPTDSRGEKQRHAH